MMLSFMNGALIAKVSCRHSNFAPVVSLSRHIADRRTTNKLTSLVPIRRVLLHACRSWDILLCLEVLSEEVLLLSLLHLNGFRNLLRELVLDATTTDLRDLVVRMRPANLIRPLHFLCLDDQASHFGLSILSWSE